MFKLLLQVTIENDSSTIASKPFFRETLAFFFLFFVAVIFVVCFGLNFLNFLTAFTPQYVRHAVLVGLHLIESVPSLYTQNTISKYR